MIKAVLFDLDDTLCDYEKSAEMSRGKMFDYAISRCEGMERSQLQRAYDESLRDMIMEQGGEAIFLRKSGREVRLELISHALHACGFDELSLAEDLVNIYEKERRNTLKLFPDALYVLSSLHVRYPLGLVTNGPSDIQRTEIDDLRIAQYFRHVIVSGEVGYAKPNPWIFKLAAARFDLLPSRILYVGNSQKEDVAGAYGAGLKVAWLNRKGERLRPETPKPHYEVKSLSELLNIL